MNEDDMNEDERAFINTLRQSTIRKRNLQQMEKRKKAINTIRNIKIRQRLFNRDKLQDSYQRTLAKKRGDGLNYNLRPIIDRLNDVLPDPIKATEGYKTVSAPDNIRINLIFTEQILPNIKESHITFIRSRLGGIITSTHFTFKFPDEWRREPVIPDAAKDLRIGIDLMGRININYRIDEDKQRPINVLGNSRHNLNLSVDYLYDNFIVDRYKASEVYTKDILRSMFRQINTILDIVNQNILNTNNLVTVITNVRGGKKSKKNKKSKKSKTKRYKKKKSKNKSYKR